MPHLRSKSSLRSYDKATRDPLPSKIRSINIVPSKIRSTKIVQTFKSKDSDITTVIKYPTTVIERNEFVNFKTGKKVTPFQFRVYDLARQIPIGHVTSYKILSDALKSSPRAVGQALKTNPFCPLPVACHRIIATDRTIGGFSGGSGDSQLTANKKSKLEAEGCGFEHDYIFKSNADGSTKFFSDFKIVQ